MTTRAADAARGRQGPRGWRERLFAIDPRGLAALRIGLALLLLCDLALRTRDLRGLYTDEGVLPRWLLEDHLRPTLVPLHLLCGEPAFQAVLFGVAAAFAVLLGLGCYTRLATIGSWALLLSLHSRIALFIQFGDDVLRLLLFWGMFLPLGRCWSLDARRSGRGPAERRRPVLSVAGAALLVQVASLYLFTGLLKTGDDWRSGDAIAVVLQYDWWARPTAHFLLETFPGALHFGTWAVLVLEVLGGLLLFSPLATRALRIGLVYLVWLFQAGLGLSIRLGLMPWINAAAVLPFLPAAWWDELERLFASPARRLGLVRGPAEPRPGATPAGARRGPARGVDGAVALLLLYMVASNVASLSERLQLPGPLVWVGDVLRIHQRWAMFAPDPPRDDGWYVIPGRLRNGAVVNLWWTGPGLSWARPAGLAEGHRSLSWSVWEGRLKEKTFDRPELLDLRRRYAEWQCRQWNARHPTEEQVVSLELWFLHEVTTDDPQAPLRVQRKLLEHRCGDLEGPERARDP